VIEFAGGRTRRVGLARLPRLLLVAVVALVAGAVGAAAGRAVLHRGEAMPGVHVLGTDVSGLSRPEVGARVRALTAERLGETVTLVVDGRRIDVVPRKLFVLDRATTTEAVLAAGRSGMAERARALLAPVTQPIDVDPLLRERPAARRRLSALLDPLAEPPVAAGVTMRGLAPAVAPAHAGTRPDLDRLLPALAARVADGAGTVPVAFEPAAPPVDDAAAEEGAEEARLLVSAPVSLTLDGRPVGRLSREQIAALLTFRPHASRLVPLLDDEHLEALVGPRVARFGTPPVDATFRVNGRIAWIVPSKPGHGLDVQAAIAAITTAAHQRGERTAALALTQVQPALTSLDAQALGIRERISTFTTEMGVSSSNRIHNVHLMADFIDGTIVRPGEVFAFNKVVGPRTEKRGFLEGQMIVGSLLLPSIGGGVCQTATTLFNNAFVLGLPILHRRNHSFYISHYPLGRDATVSWGGPEFAFRNDLENGILIKAKYTDETLTFSFYGTEERRRVTSRTGPKTNWRQPKLTYALDPAAPRGSMRVVSGTHQAGFDVTVFRLVRDADGRVLRRNEFKSSYISVGPTAIYGPGRTIPGSYFVIPRT
jgi:vancomycin resistance protein YoaR